MFSLDLEIFFHFIVNGETELESEKLVWVCRRRHDGMVAQRDGVDGLGIGSELGEATHRRAAVAPVIGCTM